MTVKELIEQLKEIDPERIVIMSSDEEGNSYSPLANLNHDMVYFAKQNEVELESVFLDPDGDFKHINKKACAEAVKKAVVFYPTL